MTDSSSLFESLKSAAIPELQARAIVQAISAALDQKEADQAKALAIKADASKLDLEVSRLESVLHQEIQKLGTDLRAEMAVMEARLEGKITESRTSMIRWMFIFWIGQIAAEKFLR